jgi:quinoprotein relay system zinc metallohydrolase 1
MKHSKILWVNSLSPFLFYLFISFASMAVADENEYDFTIEKVSQGTYVFLGKNEEVNIKNGGNISNTAFVVTNSCIVVFDTGSSRKYAKKMKEVITSVSKLPICLVINSHFHPDHFLGNSEFNDIDIIAFDETINQINKYAETFRDRFYNLLGGWMTGTEIVIPKPVSDNEFTIGGHDFKIIKYKGHSGADLVLHDKTTNTLFVGDLVFNKRAPSTAHTKNLESWIEELNELSTIDFDVLVPGHGPVSVGPSAINSTKNHLKWLDELFLESSKNGGDINEVMEVEIPKELKQNVLSKYELSRSAVHLYHQYEERMFE